MADAAPEDEDAGPSRRSALKLFGSAWRDYMEKEIGSGRHSADTLEALASVFALLTSLACTRDRGWRGSIGGTVQGLAG